MTKTFTAILFSFFLFACKHKDDKVETEYYKFAKMLRFERKQNLPFLLSDYMYGKHREIVWSEHLIDEDSVNTQRQRQDLDNERAKIDRFQFVCDSLFAIAFKPGTEKYVTALEYRYSDSIGAESAIRDKQLAWENNMMSDLLFKGFGVKQAWQIVDSVSIQDFYTGNPPVWYIQHRETKLKRYKKEFGTDFK